MSRESMKDIIENSIKSAGTSETEVAEWVVNLKSYHDEETKRREQREFDFRVQIHAHNIIAESIERTGEQLDARVKALAQLEVQVAQEREELQRIRGSLEWERERLAKTIEKLEPDPSVYLGVGVAAALFALFISAVVQWLGPPLVRWVASLF